jgi:hypothetical protein
MTANTVKSLIMRPLSAGFKTSGAECTPVNSAGCIPGIPAECGYCPCDAGRERSAARYSGLPAGPLPAAVRCEAVPGVERDGMFLSPAQISAPPGCFASGDGYPEMPAGTPADEGITMMHW